MKPFFSAIRLSLRYKLAIVGALACSMLIAVCWSASITTVFPVVKIVLEGQTAETWVEHEIELAKLNLTVAQTAIDELQEKIDEASGDERTVLSSAMKLKKNRAEGERKSLERYKSLQPWLQTYAPKSAFATLLWALAWLLAVTAAKGLLLVGGAIFDSRVAHGTVRDMRRIYYRKALALDQQRIDGIGTANVMTDLSFNMQMIAQGLRVFYGKCLREPLKMISCLVCAAYISLPLLMLSLVIVPAGAFVIHSVSRRMKNASMNELTGVADVYQTLMETFKAVKTVRIFNQERAERRRFKENASMLYRMSVKIALYDSLLRPVTEVLSILSISLSMMVGAYLVLNQETHLFGIQISQVPIKPTMLLVFYSMLAGAADPLRKMSEIVNAIVRANVACNNLQNKYDVKSWVTAPDQPAAVPQHSESLEIKNVTFSYWKSQEVLKNVDLKVPFGQTVAIVGGNGCGKSTLMNLIARFYDPTEGQILLVGVNIRRMSPRKLRRQIAWVTQDSVLFQGTVWDNIAYGNRDAAETEIMAAAKLARVDQYVDQLEHGFHTMVGDEGRNLSAGQRQRVALARAILADPKILILDEATSQIDGETENLIHDSLVEFIEGRTTFIVTHRHSSLRLADRVLVMDLGKIVHDSSVADATENSAQFQSLFARVA